MELAGLKAMIVDVGLSAVERGYGLWPKRWGIPGRAGDCNYGLW